MSRTRYFFLAAPPVDVGNRMQAAIDQLRLSEHLRASLVVRANWHQSLSGRYWPDEMPDVEQRLRRAGGLIAAQAITMTLTWIVSKEGYAAMKPRGVPVGFADLLSAVSAPISKQGLMASAQNTPHITLSYLTEINEAPVAIEPIEWTIDRVVLVRSEGDGADYCYREIESWDLPAAPLKPQLDLF